MRSQTPLKLVVKRKEKCLHWKPQIYQFRPKYITWYSTSFSRMTNGSAAVSDKSTLLGDVGSPAPPPVPLVLPFTILLIR